MKHSNSINLYCENCSKALDEKLLIATQCLHRFCAACTTNASICPLCGVTTKFQQDSNFSRLFSKMKNSTKTTKRQIVDILKNDGADLKGFTNMGRTNIMKRFKSESPTETSLSNPNEPCTSSNAMTATNDNFYKHHNQVKRNNNISSDGEFQMPNPMIVNLNHRQALSRNFSKMEAIVLWPDGINYRIRELPKCLLRPRYLFIPFSATVAHLVEYLFKRAELEAGVELRYKYQIEFMPIEDEKDEINLWVNPMRNIDYLSIEFKSNMQDSNTGEYVLILRKNQEDSYFCTNLIMQHPFKPLDEGRNISELLNEHQCFAFANPTTNICFDVLNNTNDSLNSQMEEEKRPPKFAFRFVPFVQDNV